MREEEIVRGYKVFGPDWVCHGKQYACPGKFEEDVDLTVCKAGMHFCKRVIDCFNYYAFNTKNRVAEVLAYGKICEEDDKCCTDKLEIVREISWNELLEIVNMGNGCTGFCNSGDRNSGDRNSGDWNSGDWNSGDWNSGNWNSGNWNSGNRNSGDWNKCSFSSGCFNTFNPKICMFNKPSEWTYADWVNSRAHALLNQLSDYVCKYVSISDMTEEKTEHPEAETVGGYLKFVSIFEVSKQWWSELSDKDKRTITSIPNFDAQIFKEITGIDVDMW
nr:MAG TPA: pentapeptide repeat protein [Bacteriophage sp.]